MRHAAGAASPAAIAGLAPAEPPVVATRRQGWQARLALEFRRDGERTVLARREHSGPLRVQKALYPEGPGLCHAVIVHPPGGIAGGDRLDIEVALAPGACALLTTPGATKWYKAPAGMAAQHVHLALAAGAVLEWLPQEAIVFDQADADSRLAVDLTGDAVFIGWEILCFGRTASAERFTRGTYRQRWQVRRDGHWLWNEIGSLEGGGRLMDSPVGLGGQPVCATLLAAGRDLPNAVLEQLRAALEALPMAHQVAATRLPALIAVRYVGPSSEAARQALVAAWAVLRPHLTGVVAETPRLWRT